MPFQIIRNDITKVIADAIVNTANPRPIVGGGTDSAIYKAAGFEELLAEREKIGYISRGDAVSTPAFKLKARFIIHTVGPKWVDGNHGEMDILRSCYGKSLELANKLGCESIAFPLISTGVYGFPKEDALNIALDEIGKFLLTHEMNVTIVVFDRRSLQVSRSLIGDISEYIDEHAVGQIRRSEYLFPIESDPLAEGDAGTFPEVSHMLFSEKMQQPDDHDRQNPEEDILRLEQMHRAEISKEIDANFKEKICAPMMSPSAKSDHDFRKIGSSLDDFLRNKGDNFQQRLFKLIDERGLSDPEVYKKANIDRKVFSKIRCNKNYKPKKKTAVAFAIALELDMEATQDLLSRAELALSPASEFDLIISYFVQNQIYDIMTINAVLFELDQPLLGYDNK